MANENEKLNTAEFRAYRALTGQLTWASENSRPDLCFDVRELATKNKYATFTDILTANKILKKAQQDEIRIKYSKLGKIKDLKIVGFTDPSYRNADEMTRSVGGRILLLTYNEEDCNISCTGK